MPGWQGHDHRSRRPRSWDSRLRPAVLRRDPTCTLRVPGVCTGASREVDHIVRPADGGDDSLDNLRGVCRECHRSRTQQQATEANKRRAEQRYRAPEQHPGLLTPAELDERRRRAAE